MEETQPAGKDERLVGSDRVLAVLLELARHPAGISLDEMAKRIDGAKPTVHRALASLRRAGLAGQDGHGHYVLGDEFLRIAFAHHEARPDHLRVQPILEQLTQRFGETSHYAVLDGHDVVYRAKVDPTVGAMKLSSTVGGRNPAHATGVGKMLLALQLPDLESVRNWVGGRKLERRTEHTAATAEELDAELSLVRQRGYSIDAQENEPGVNCVALPVYLSSPSVPTGAISISALAYRTPLATLVSDLPTIRKIIAGQYEEAIS
ncbi:IclR family transcriptional regulator [Paenarthrobacter sp. NPDC091669]|uniref:IclR family transcriptional regulator n=1 Tax=Paenarthrobacter sp. NPDC091669 TaxID=3364384 RepID=UPI00382CA941